MAHLELLDAELRELQLELPISQKRILTAYCDELAHWNKKINLTGLKGVDMVRRLVVEPVWVGLQLKPKGVLADIGSGNGSPAFPLHVTCHFDRLHMIEARTKRAAFLRHVATTLNVPDVKIHRGRFEDVGVSLGKADWITLQAVAPTKKLIEAIRKNCSATTTVVWITSHHVSTELTPVKTLSIPNSGTRILLFQLDLS